MYNEMFIQKKNCIKMFTLNINFILLMFAVLIQFYFFEKIFQNENSKVMQI